MSKNYVKEISDLIVSTSALTGNPITTADFTIVHQPLNHDPLPLPEGRMAIYTFVYHGQFLKIGQANYKSRARYQSQHYHVNSAKSTLANSLVKDKSMPMVNEANVTSWIKENCERYDVLIDANKFGKVTLNFIEGLLQHTYMPKYEG